MTPIAKCADDGSIVAVYKSMREASRLNNLYQSNIFKSCNSNIKCGGYHSMKLNTLSSIIDDILLELRNSNVSESEHISRI